MAKDVEQLVIQMSADIRRMEKALDRAQGKFDKTAREMERRKRELDRSLSELGSTIGTGLGRASVAAGLALGAITVMSLNAAKRAEAVDGAFKHTFRDMPKEAERAVSGVAQQFGRLETDIKDNFNQLRSVVVALGVDGAQSLQMVEALQRRALDLAAFKDVSDPEAFRAVISGITGETEPLKRFGVVLNETAVKAELVRLGFKGNASEASEAAKVIARANIILRQTAEVEGQVARESDTLTEQEKRMRVEFTRAAEDLGRQFLPVAKDVTHWAAETLRAFNELPDGVKVASLAFLGLVAAGGPIMAVVSGLMKLIETAARARAALAGVAGANVAAGAAAGAGARAGLTAGAAGGVLGLFGIAGVSALSASQAYRVAADPTKASDAELVSAARKIQGMLDSYQKTDPGRAKDFSPGSIGGRYREQLAALQREQERRAKAAAEAAQRDADAAASAALAGLGGGFQLTPEQLAPAGGGKSGKGKDLQAEAERKAREALRQADRFNAEMERARDRELSAELIAGVSIERRAEIELDRLRAEAEARAEDLRLAVQRGELTKAQAAEIAAAEARARSAERTAIIADKEERLADERLRHQEALADLAAELLAIQAGQARTARERRRRELQLLAVQDESERRALEAELTRNRNLTEAQRSERRAALATMQQGRREDLASRPVGAMAEWRDASLRSADEVAEALEAVAARGLDALASGIVDAITGAKSLGEAFHNVARQIIADLAEIAVRKAIVEPLANFLLPGSGNIIGALTGRRAGGGPVKAGGVYLTGERGPEPFVPTENGIILSNNIMRALQRPPQAGVAATVVTQHISFDNRGALIWEGEFQRLLAEADRRASVRDAVTLQATRNLTQVDAVRAARRRLA